MKQLFLLAENKASQRDRNAPSGLNKMIIPLTSVSNLLKSGYRKDFKQSSRSQEAQTLLWANDFQFLTTVLSRGNHPQHTQSIGTIADNNAKGAEQEIQGRWEFGKWGKHTGRATEQLLNIHSKITQPVPSTRLQENKDLRGHYSTWDPKENKI